MGMLDAQRRISKQVYFSTKRLGEEVEYNGTPLIALVYIGASASRTDWNDAATSVENANLADLATFSICDDDIETPQEGDIIKYKEDEYAVVQIIEHDVAGSHWVLFATKGERAFGR